MNRFFKIKAVIALICIIIALCVVSIGMAVKISITTLEKKDNLVRAKSSDTHTVSNNPQKNVNVLNFSNARKLDFYFNGLMLDGFTCYAGDNGETLLPLDQLFKELDIGFKFINPDDAVTAEVFGKRLVVRLNSLDASYGGEKFKLNTASVVQGGHILVSIDILSRLQDLVQYIAVQENAVFLNSWPATLNKAYDSFSLIKVSGNRLESCRISGAEPKSKVVEGLPVFDEIYPVSDNKGYLIRSGTSFYLLNGSLKPSLLSVGKDAQLSGTHKQIYWTDKKKKRLYIYDVKSGTTRSYRNHTVKIAKTSGRPQEQIRLYDYEAGGRYARFDFSVGEQDNIYTVIERNGKVAVEGRSFYSPDGRKLAYFVNDKGYYAANYDGTGIMAAGTGYSVNWIDNNRFIINSMVSMSVFDTVSKMTLPVDIARTFAGSADNGDIFSIRDDVLYTGAGMNAKKLFRLPWSCDYVYAQAGSGPYMILSQQKESVYCLLGNSSFIAANTGKFINKKPDMSAEDTFRHNSAVAPGKGKMAFLQNEEGLLQVNLVDIKEFKLQKVVIDSRFGEQTDSVFEMLWLDDERLLLHSGDKGWVLDLSSGTHVNSWSEADSGSIIGFFKTKKLCK